MKSSEELKAGVIGLGQIGGGIAVSLTNSKRAVVVYDVLPEAAEKWPGLPALLPSPLEVAKASDVIMVAVFSGDQVRSVLEGSEGLLAGAHEGMTVVVLSTIGTEDNIAFYDLCKSKGVGYLDCGVSPGQLSDKNGLTAMVGGDKDVFDCALPILNDWARDVIYCGGNCAGMVTKIARNVITYSSWRSTTEAARLAATFGIDVGVFVSALESCDRVEQLFYTLLHARRQTGKVPGQMADMLENYVLKDMSAALHLAEEKNLDMPVAQSVLDLLSDTLDR
jgi:3-hydroxyisobutyrate dehydrogenase-like beta-hydroxyacid dehydrogenase